MPGENNDTRGMSQRELILEIRQDIKKLEEKLDAKIGRGELLAWLAGTSAVVGLALKAMGV